MPESPKPKGKIAILYDKESKLSPSNPSAIQKFIEAGNRQGYAVDIIKINEYMHLFEYDILFIRETTGIDNPVMKMAMMAENFGMVVMDSPRSIKICGDKEAQTRLFSVNDIPTPETYIIYKYTNNITPPIKQMPIIIKNPYGCFSNGVYRVHGRSNYARCVTMLFEKVQKLIVQEYMETAFDWRIGILNNNVLFACKYYMTAGSWKVIKHNNKGEYVDGESETLPIDEVPPYILGAAIMAARCVGNGLYGVDIKEIDGKPYVIEINDNPNIDAGIEDEILGDELYDKIMLHLIQQHEWKSRVKASV